MNTTPGKTKDDIIEEIKLEFLNGKHVFVRKSGFVYNINSSSTIKIRELKSEFPMTERIHDKGKPLVKKIYSTFFDQNPRETYAMIINILHWFDSEDSGYNMDTILSYNMDTILSCAPQAESKSESEKVLYIHVNDVFVKEIVENWSISWMKDDPKNFHKRPNSDLLVKILEYREKYKKNEKKFTVVYNYLL